MEVPVSDPWRLGDDDSDLPMTREYDEVREARARMRRELGYRQATPMPYGYDPNNVSEAERERRAFDPDTDAERRAYDPNYGRG